MQEDQKIRLVLDSLPDGVVTFDLDGRVLHCNQTAQAMLHLDPSHIGTISFLALAPVVSLFLREARHGDKEMIDLDGQAVQLTYQDLKEDGQRVGAVLLLSDIGEQTRVERIRREFTANVSHELKTPLTSISGYAELIATGMARTEDIPDFAERIRRESNRMLALVSDIIKLTELDERGMAQATEAVDLYALAAESIENLRSAAMLRGVTIHLSGAKMFVNGNRTLLSELIYNLVDNAIRYNRDNGTVAVRVSNNVLTVRDTGIGIPKAHQNRIFERFYRVDKSRSKATGGTGLGLAIVKHICEQHHAAISLSSREGIGTEITITFPS